MSDKTTDQMILDLVAAGFELPDFLTPHFDRWIVDTEENIAIRVPPQRVHDLCACEFARQRGGAVNAPFAKAMWSGDSAAAIKALWEAVCTWA